MSRYATTEDIQNGFKSITFSSDTTPTEDQVDGFITTEEANVHAFVGLKYETPIDSSVEAYEVVKGIVIDLVTGKVKNLLAVKTGSDEANQGKISDGDTLIKSAKEMLEKIKTGELRLIGATLLSSDDGVKSGNVANSVCPKFRRGRTMW